MQHVTGDLLSAPSDYIAHQANCRGVMGAGLAKQIRILNPKLFELYQQFCRNYKATDLLGKSFIYNNIITVFGQLNYGFDKSVVYTDYNALRRAFTAIHNRLPIDKSIAFPFGFGCGLANGDWNIVEQLINDCFPNRTIYIIKKGV
jgi:O-acetyl-ADP-ribose deacetylase (regulator of RNase III)